MQHTIDVLIPHLCSSYTRCELDAAFGFVPTLVNLDRIEIVTSEEYKTLTLVYKTKVRRTMHLPMSDLDENSLPTEEYMRYRILSGRVALIKRQLEYYESRINFINQNYKEHPKYLDYLEIAHTELLLLREDLNSLK